MVVRKLVGKQTAVWHCLDGRSIRVCDMHDKHLLNTLNMMRRNFEHNKEMLEENKISLNKQKAPKELINVLKAAYNEHQSVVTGWIKIFEAEAEWRGLDL